MKPRDPEKSAYYRSLTRNVRIIVIIISFIPLVVVSSGILFQFHTTYREKVRAHLETLVKKHKQNIDHFLTERQHNISFLGVTYGFKELSDNDFLAVQLQKLQNTYGPVFSDLGVVRADGTQVSYAGPFSLTRAQYAEADWFRKAIAADAYTSDVFLGLRGFPHFIVTHRGFEEGSPWILRATVDFMAFNDLVESIHIGETGFAYIINHSGELQTRTSGREIPEDSPYLSLFDADDPAAAPDRIQVRSRYSEREGELIYVAGLLKNGQWALIYQQNVRDAYRSLNQIRNAALIVFVLGGIAIVTMAVVLSKRMVDRIAESDQEKEVMNQQVIESGHLASLGELAAGIAHEINNPVAIMVEEAGWIEDLLEEETFQESENLSEFRRALGQIRKQGIRARDITHKLLSFARRSDSRAEMVNVNELIREVVGLSVQQARYTNVTVKTDLEVDLPDAKVSQTELQQVLFNLINNAIDAMGKDGGTIDIRSRVEDGGIRLEVEDTGPGIPPVNLNRIFEPFFTTKPVGKGTGLGLSICYGIVKKMGGDITVESTVGKGTRFDIFIPAMAAAEPGGAVSVSHRN